MSLCALSSPGGSANPLFESYESGLAEWTPQAYLAVPDPTWEWSVARSTVRASHGIWSLELTASGVHDDGTVWIERSLQMPAGEWEVRLDFDLWSSADADVGTWQKVAFIGTFDPREESHFTVLGLEDFAGWRTYSTTRKLTLPAAGTVWVAFGVNIVFETTHTHFLDAVTIRWSPAQAIESRTWTSVKALYR